MDFNKKDSEIVITDPQNDFLSPDGVTRGLVGDSVQAKGTVGHIEDPVKATKQKDYNVFISPHCYYPTDKGWQVGGTVENMMHEIWMFGRKCALSTDGFAGSGADWLEQYKTFIDDGKTIVASPHKVYGPETNDLVLQLGKRGEFPRSYWQECRPTFAPRPTCVSCWSRVLRSLSSGTPQPPPSIPNWETATRQP